MIVSIAIAVLPVCRSPMISCRCPRPIAVIASMALVQAPSVVQRGVLDRAEAVERLAERADHAAEERVPDGHGQDLAGPLDRLALLNARELTKDNDADLAYIEVQRDAADAVLELKKLVCH